MEIKEQRSKCRFTSIVLCVSIESRGRGRETIREKGSEEK